MLIERIILWIRQRFCRHKYKKHWNKKTKEYERRCVYCEKVW